jgi:hypothetical protein
VNYHEGNACFGPVVHVAPLPIDTHCAASTGGGSSQTTCAFGDYHPSPAAINVNVFSNLKNVCPIDPAERPNGVVEFLYEHCFSDGAQSYWYSCSPTAVTGVSFASADCSGTPHPKPVIPLGCYANASDPSGSPQFTLCPRGDAKAAVPLTKASAQLRGVPARALEAQSLRAVPVPAALEAALAVETARALEILAARRV